jgi:hypothetical protein
MEAGLRQLRFDNFEWAEEGGEGVLQIQDVVDVVQQLVVRASVTGAYAGDAGGAGGGAGGGMEGGMLQQLQAAADDPAAAAAAAHMDVDAGMEMLCSGGVMPLV